MYLKACNSALDLLSGHEKALYRRAKAYMGKGRPALALADMRAVVARKPNNKTFRLLFYSF